MEGSKRQDGVPKGGGRMALEEGARWVAGVGLKLAPVNVSSLVFAEKRVMYV